MCWLPENWDGMQRKGGPMWGERRRELRNGDGGKSEWRNGDCHKITRGVHSEQGPGWMLRQREASATFFGSIWVRVAALGSVFGNDCTRGMVQAHR